MRPSRPLIRGTHTVSYIYVNLPWNVCLLVGVFYQMGWICRRQHDKGPSVLGYLRITCTSIDFQNPFVLDFADSSYMFAIWLFSSSVIPLRIHNISVDSTECEMLTYMDSVRSVRFSTTSQSDCRDTKQSYRANRSANGIKPAGGHDTDNMYACYNTWLIWRCIDACLSPILALFFIERNYSSAYRA